jgi:hypothetical protein
MKHEWKKAVYNFTRESKIHREIYLFPSRKVNPDKLKTVLRFKIILP